MYTCDLYFFIIKHKLFKEFSFTQTSTKKISATGLKNC